MRDDMLKEQLMSYARTAADEAAQPDAAAIRRRARRHYRRVAALTVAGVLVVAGVGVGLGLRRGDGAPAVGRPNPPATGVAPVTPPTTTPTPTSTPHPTTTTGTVAAGPPSSFVALVGPAASTNDAPSRIGVVSSSTGRIVRYLTGPAPAGTSLSRPALSPDRVWVYYSLTGAGGRAGTYRVPFAGGPATKVSGISGYSLAVSPDGSTLLFDTWTVPGRRYGLTFLDLDGGRERFTPFPFARAGGIFGYAWSPDSRQVALVRGPIMDSETFPEQLFLLEVASGRWRTAVSFDAAKGPAPVAGELGLAWPAPRRVTFVARTGSDTAAGSYRLVGVDPRTGKLTPSAVLASDPNSTSRLQLDFLDFDVRGRYLLYSVAGVNLSTRWLGDGAPVRVSQFSALSDRQTHAYKGGAW
jgi:hypothetical protein